MKSLAAVITAIAAIAGLEAYAIHQGIDGAILGIVITAIAGLGGYELKALKNKRKENDNRKGEGTRGRDH